MKTIMAILGGDDAGGDNMGTLVIEDAKEQANLSKKESCIIHPQEKTYPKV